MTLKFLVSFFIGSIALCGPDADAGVWSWCNFFFQRPDNNEAGQKFNKPVEPNLKSAGPSDRKWAVPTRAGGEYVIDQFRTLSSQEALAKTPEAITEAKLAKAGDLKKTILERSVESYVGVNTAIEFSLENQKTYRGKVHNALKEDPYHVEFFDYATGEVVKIDLREVQSAHIDGDSEIQIPKNLRGASWEKIGKATGQGEVAHFIDTGILEDILSSGFLGRSEETKTFLSSFSFMDTKKMSVPVLFFKTKILDSYWNPEKPHSSSFYIGSFNKYGNHHADNPQSFFYSATPNEIVFEKRIPLHYLERIQVPKGERDNTLLKIKERGIVCPVMGKTWEDLIVEGNSEVYRP